MKRKKPKKRLTKKDALGLERMWQRLSESQHDEYRVKYAKSIRMIEKALGRTIEIA